MRTLRFISFFVAVLLTLVSTFGFSTISFAQGQSMQGGKRQLIMFNQEINNVAANPITCPVGWTDAYGGLGYGPHYVGMSVYDWDGGGWAPGWWYPPSPPGRYRGPVGEVPPDSNPPEDPPPPPPGLPVNTPGGGYYPGEYVPPPVPGPVGPDGEPLDPAGGYLPPYVNPEGFPEPLNPGGPLDGNPGSPQGLLVNKLGHGLASLLKWLVGVAEAQPASWSYVLNDFDIDGVSVCSNSQKMIVESKALYQNTSLPYTGTILFADSCYGPTCNRCRVCVK